MKRFDWLDWSEVGEWAIFLGSIAFAIVVLVYAWMGGLRDPAAYLGF